MTGWLDGWTQRRGNDAGTWGTGPRHPKLVLHTTEGGSITGAVGAYMAHNSWPHATVDPATRERVQHLPLTVPARALRNTPTPGETNRAPTVIQVEIVGRAADTPRWSPAMLDWLGTGVVAPICQAAGIPIRTGVIFHGPDAGWTLAQVDARQRLTRGEWDAYEGILGHQHVPEQTHWDPGAIDITRIITAAGGTPAPTPVPVPPMEGDDMPARFLRHDRTGVVWLVSPAGKIPVPDRTALAAWTLSGVVTPHEPTAASGAWLDTIPTVGAPR